MNEEHEQRVPAGKAPYDREQDTADRSDDDPARPWKQAGRSWSAQARRLDTYYRAHGTTGDKMRSKFAVHGHPEVFRLKARATAAIRTARTLDRLSASGWVVLHDRRLVGTEETLDHVAIGPGGVTAIQSVDPEGTPPPGVPVAASVHFARDRLMHLQPFIADAVSARLALGWDVLIFGMIAVNGTTLRVDEYPPVRTCQEVPTALESHRRTFSRMQVADLAMTLESAFPFAPIGDERR